MNVSTGRDYTQVHVCWRQPPTPPTGRKGDADKLPQPKIDCVLRGSEKSVPSKRYYVSWALLWQHPTPFFLEL
ncbi:hypothetical protein PROFUN_03564 [Planoprotostelium fungivorum]|uniref:Uncharacterized protein n=1 Tax=Planoprotostelium fungivorum TaxID=1890364 RepID=A0A2P6MSG0_9EUKA|nr:hypothetical protein PROFUN_03564 [Planoprotostelium fungivorum]